MMWSIFSYGHHPYILFGQVSVKAFGSLFNQVAHFLIVSVIVEFLNVSYGLWVQFCVCVFVYSHIYICIDIYSSNLLCVFLIL